MLTRPCLDLLWLLSNRTTTPVPRPRKCAVAPADTRCPSSAAPQLLYDWPGEPLPQRSAPWGSLSPWRSPQKILEGEQGSQSRGRRKVGLGICLRLLTNEMFALSDYWLYAKVMMCVNALRVVFASGSCRRRASACTSTGESKRAGCDHRRSCTELCLMSHETHGPVALDQLPLVKAVCKHSGWALIMFIAWSISSLCVSLHLHMCVHVVQRNVHKCLNVNQVYVHSKEGTSGVGLCVMNLPSQAGKNNTWYPHRINRMHSALYSKTRHADRDTCRDKQREAVGWQVWNATGLVSAPVKTSSLAPCAASLTRTSATGPHVE